MTPKEFYNEVVKMRNLQKQYFRTRSSVTLEASKRQERLIDNEIKRVELLTKKNEPTLF